MNKEILEQVTDAFATLGKQITAYPERFTVTHSPDGNRIVINPDGADYGMIIGAGGRMILAMKYVVSEIGKRNGMPNLGLDVLENQGSSPPLWKRFELSMRFDKEHFLPVLKKFLVLLFRPAVPTVKFDERFEKVHVILDVPESELHLVMALGSMFYPFGFKLGRKVTFRVKNLQLNLNPTHAT